MIYAIPRSERNGAAREFYAVVRARPSEAAVVAGRFRTASQALPAAAPSPGHRPAELLEQLPFDAVSLVPLATHLARRERPAFSLVLAASGILLLLACVNLAGLVAARNIERRRELAVRTALGASGWTLARGLLVELALPAVLATVFALLMSRPLLVWTIDLLPPTIHLLKEPVIDRRVFMTALAIALSTCVIVSLWPARLAIRLGATSRFDDTQANATRPIRRLAAPLVALQVTVGFVLLAAGGLTVSSLAAAWQTNVGFQRDRTLLLEVFVSESASRQETIDKFSVLPTLIAGVEGVQGVAVSSVQPFFQQRITPWSTVVPEGWKGNLAGVAERRVSANYFELMGLTLREGRWPSAAEWNDGRVAVVSQTAARMLWPGQTALGRGLVARSRAATPMTVIGVVADTRYVALDSDPIADLYLPLLVERGRYGAFFHIRTVRGGDEVLGPILAALAGRGYYVAQASTHADALFASVKHRALPAWLFGSLGIGALVVLGTGILGLLAMSAAQRTREIGIRVAMGATRARVIGLLMREQVPPLLTGLGIGGLVSYWAGGVLKARLHGIEPHDLTVWTAVAATIVLVALLGTLVPALKVVRADPITALRTE